MKSTWIISRIALVSALPLVGFSIYVTAWLLPQSWSNLVGGRADLAPSVLLIIATLWAIIPAMVSVRYDNQIWQRAVVDWRQKYSLLFACISLTVSTVVYLMGSLLLVLSH
ncbi:hypothetical protein [Devosia sp. RR2S18]|uniref:hypothetical protein n=1 Tax=Devosia rhizosphaerae TaxID=3049774 RepID=UPI002540CDC5|nr:hypothetical protein [Devosia sp. RR2S18]WIJ23928.1 hypothetical protein QOV41_12865 [Devosia sp. RR2S18]